MARASRRKSKGKGTNGLYIGVAAIGGGILVVLAMLLFATMGKDTATVAGGNFSAEQYVKRGSVSVGNTYRIEASVVEVHSHGSSRIVEVLTHDNYRIGLFVPSGSGFSNIRKGMDYVFTVKGKNGQLEDGSHVKGILVVVDVEAK